MEIRFDGQVALITGASSGIGRASAIEFAKSGAKVVVNYNSNEKAAAEIVALIKANGGEDWTTAVMVDDNIRKKRKTKIDDREMTYETELGMIVTTKCKPKSDYHFFVHRNLKALRDLETTMVQEEMDINLKYATWRIKRFPSTK